MDKEIDEFEIIRDDHKHGPDGFFIHPAEMMAKGGNHIMLHPAMCFGGGYDALALAAEHKNPYALKETKPIYVKEFENKYGKVIKKYDNLEDVDNIAGIVDNIWRTGIDTNDQFIWDELYKLMKKAIKKNKSHNIDASKLINGVREVYDAAKAIGISEGMIFDAAGKILYDIAESTSMDYHKYGGRQSFYFTWARDKKDKDSLDWKFIKRKKKKS